MSGSLVLLSLVAAALVSVLPVWGRGARPLGAWLVGWLATTALLTGGAYVLGTAHAEATCTAGICFADLAGLLWAALVLPVCVVLAVADGVRRSRVRPTRPPAARRRRSAAPRPAPPR
jgi:hypothetical protein